MAVLQSDLPMPTLTAIQSYLGWHISLMVVVWGVFLVRFDRVAKEFFHLRHDDSWEAQVVRWGIILGLDLLIPAVFAVPAFYYTGLFHHIGWLNRVTAWIGYLGFFFTLTLMVLLRMGSKSCCCCVGRPRGRHWHRPDSPNRRRHSKPEDDASHEVI